MDLSQYRLAKDIGVSARRISSINKILKGEWVITTDTALRLGRFFKMPVQLWLNLQSHYAIWKSWRAEDRLDRRLEWEVKMLAVA